MNSQVDRFIQQAAFFKLVARKHWPAPLTLIGVARPELPAALTASTHTLESGCRMTRTCALFVACVWRRADGHQRNVSGQPPARTAKEVENYFPAGIDLIVDGGEVTATEASDCFGCQAVRRRAWFARAQSRATSSKNCLADCFT